jgi:hypothetical protein
MYLFQSAPLTDSLLRGLSLYELRLLRNEVYARHGRRFQTPWLRDYFKDALGDESDRGQEPVCAIYDDGLFGPLAASPRMLQQRTVMKMNAPGKIPSHGSLLIVVCA